MDFIPFTLNVLPYPTEITLNDRFERHEADLLYNIERIKLGLEAGPESFIPTLRPEMGCVILQSGWGSKWKYSNIEGQYPRVVDHIIKKPEDIFELKRIDPRSDGLMPKALERLDLFIKETKGMFETCLLELNGPFNTAIDLIENTELYLMLYDMPDAVKRLLDVQVDAFMDFLDAQLNITGGISKVATTGFIHIWCPEEYRCLVCDDLSATISPELFLKYSVPANNRIYQKYGMGILHNCGPHPSLKEYFEHNPPIKALHVDGTHTSEDFKRIKEIFPEYKAILMIEWYDKPIDFQISEYSKMVDVLAPDVIAIATFTTQNKDRKENRKIFNEILSISMKYSKMIFG
ncbi:MAG: hypothetical protein M1371_03760 [Actinobacteria bacterium]|nr:hypothetical protein [Actinomycetota bacterium]